MMTLLLALSTAFAAAPLGRTLEGAPLAPSGPVALVFWSQDCARCGERMAALEASGVPMISVNTDAAALRAGLLAFSRRHQLSSPTISDADGALQRRFQIEDGIVVLGDRGGVVWREGDTCAAIGALLDAPLSVWEGVQLAGQP